MKIGIEHPPLPGASARQDEAEQPPLPFEHFNVPPRHVEWLALANAGNYPEKKHWFYPFKTRFLRAHALPDGFDLQIITLKCWCGDGIFRGIDYERPKDLWEQCDRCGGTGIYLKKRIPLIRWRLDGRLFHEPMVNGTSMDALGRLEYRETFEGLVKHQLVPDRMARRAMEKMLLRYEPRTFYQLWLSRWRAWRDWKGHKIRWQIVRVKQLLSFRQQDDVPF